MTDDHMDAAGYITIGKKPLTPAQIKSAKTAWQKQWTVSPGRTTRIESGEDFRRRMEWEAYLEQLRTRHQQPGWETRDDKA